MPRLALILLTFLALGMLAGCAALAPRPPAAPPEDLSQIDRWQASGRLGVSGPQDGGSGSFLWRQIGDRAEIDIRGPIGIGSIRLEVRGSGPRPSLELRTGDGQRLRADAAWAELEARLGGPAPVGQLRYWMLGLAAPGEHQWIEQGPDGAMLEQSGWRIDYQRYSAEPGVRVPVRMRATSGEARVRIIVDRWRFGQ
ncbi:MAG TPA: lipoprotein insertase outer membrane protein LolB [Steroidobacter sp.]|jgi:outer membrane lipoprotein LolB|nr:lipoprotein insertase outer membrane protein LolB [Steroidobacteraceae bacterium]HLS80992.1 lipoprotein insertase outer membrane protein LolB [Steroidobacter sp.]